MSLCGVHQGVADAVFVGVVMKTAEEWSRELFPAETPLTGPVSKENSAYRIIRQIQREAFIQGAMTARGAVLKPVQLLRAPVSHLLHKRDSLNDLEQIWLEAAQSVLLKHGYVS